MKKIILLTGLLTWFIPFIPDVSAQKSAIIKGRIIDQATSETMPGVNVVEIDDKGRFVSGTISDNNGNYILKVKDIVDSIQVSFIGYKKSVFSIDNRTVINVALELESTTLQEVRVTASKVSHDGVTQVRDLGTAVTRMELMEMKSVMSTSVEELLQGRMGNVDITAVSGDPGAGLNIRIRGTASLNAKNNPLIVVNGIQYSPDFENFDFANADVQKFGNLIDVSPEDIESIEVLKDAASTAVWGSSASNGVIMIKTKRGIKSKPIFEYTIKNTIAKEPDPIPMLDNGGYARLIREEVYNYNIISNHTESTPAYFNQIDFEPSKLFNYYNFTQNTNWVEEITQTAYTQQHDFSVRGGGDKAKYNLSVGYYDEGGTVIGNRSRKLNLRSSLDYDLSTKLQFKSDIMYTRYNDDATFDRDDWDFRDNRQIRAIAYRKMPNLTVYERDTNNIPTSQYFTAPTLQGSSSDVYNPVALAKLGVNNTIKDNARALFNIRYTILPQLIFNSTVTLDIFDSKQSKFLPVEVTGDYNSSLANKAVNIFSKKSSVFTKNQLVYNPKLGTNHSLGIIGQFDTEETLERGLNVETNLSSSRNMQQPVGEKNITDMSSDYSRYRSMGVFLSANYKYKDKYLLMVGAKGEGTSKFSADSRWGIFPTGSFAWRVSEESFLQDVEFIDDFKLRISWGRSGNLPDGKYLYFNEYESYSGLNYMDIRGTKPTGMELTSLRWETIEQTDLGFNLSLFAGRFDVTFDVYNKKTLDLYLKETDIPSTSGFTKLNVNSGEMQNRGLELAIYCSVIKRENFQFDVNINFSRNQNIVVSLPDNYSFETGNVLNNGEYLMKVIPGEPLGGFYGYRYLGVYSRTSDAVATDKDGNPIIGLDGYPLSMQMGNVGSEKYTFVGGDARYQDINHDGKIDALDVVYLGDLNPDYMGGGETRFRYKNLTLSAFLNFKYGSKIINQTRMYAENMSGFDNQTTATNSRWRGEGDVTDVPRALWEGPGGATPPYGYNWLGSDRFVEDGTFLRLKTVSLMYAFSTNFCDKLRIKDLKIYVTGYNLYTWTRYSGQDPDVAPPSKPDKLPVDNNLTPPSRRLMLSINITF
ncbi:MAG: SusC/RagA family TonB-linked outer membrane protein [Bacteroidales bacterium]|nr:SusC/RagA family TonB-linked outer membrane protein [Bacteroidales bacterium]